MSLSTQVLIDLFEAVEPLVSEASREKLVAHRQRLQEDVSPPEDLDVEGAIAARPWEDWDAKAAIYASTHMAPLDPDPEWQGVPAVFMPSREMRAGDRVWSFFRSQWGYSPGPARAKGAYSWVKRRNVATVTTANVARMTEPYDPDPKWDQIPAIWLEEQRIQAGDRYWYEKGWHVLLGHSLSGPGWTWVKRCNPEYVATLLKELEHARSR